MVPLPTRAYPPFTGCSSLACTDFPRPGGEIDRYRPAIQSYLRRRGFNGEDVEDLTQETLIRAYLNLPGFRGNNLGGWLYRIAGNLAIDHVRHQRRNPQLSLDAACLHPEAVGADPELLLMGSGSDFDLWLHLEGLAPEQQKLLHLRFLERQSIREIAERLNCTPGAAKLRLFRAITALRRRLNVAER